MLIDVEEVGGADVGVAVGVAGVDRVELDRGFHVESSGFSAVTMVPPKSPKRPRTLLTIRWRTVNDTSVCTGSIFQVPVRWPGTVLRLIARTVGSWGDLLRSVPWPSGFNY